MIYKCKKCNEHLYLHNSVHMPELTTHLMIYHDMKVSDLQAKTYFEKLK